MNEQDLPDAEQISDGPNFEEFGLLPEILKAVAGMGYETPSPIQLRSIPPLLEGCDLLGVAQTGTGKTAAFALPLLSRLDPNLKAVQMLCLAPTRELAIQVADAMEGFAEHIPGLRILPVYGGTGYSDQIRELKRGAQIVVGTPGRVMDHVQKKYMKLDQVKAMVLDEADEMLSMGFIEDIEWILEQTPSDRQTALFSATMPKPIRKLADKHLNEPVEITIEVKRENAPNIRQRFLNLRPHEKQDILARILEIEPFGAVLIFARTKNATTEIAENLMARGYAAEALNGDMPQKLREKTVDRLRKGHVKIVVATDVAARGLDVDVITHVVNYDAPFDLESYTHRIGRTGRAGRKGDAILFVTNKEMRMLKAIERTLKAPCEEYSFPTLEEMNERRMGEFFSRIEGVSTADLSDYRQAIQRYLEESGKDSIEVAAALAFLEGGKKTLFYDEMPTVSRKPKRERRERGNDRDGRDDRYVSNDDLQSYRVEVGEYHGAEKRDLVGAIANEIGMDPKFIGKIRMFKDHSFIDLPKDMPKEVFEALRQVWVQGHQLNLSIDRGRPRPGGKGGKFGGKGGGGFRKGAGFRKDGGGGGFRKGAGGGGFRKGGSGEQNFRKKSAGRFRD
jgi:ATP-dependent RNA helicase DeaD